MRHLATPSLLSTLRNQPQHSKSARINWNRVLETLLLLSDIFVRYALPCRRRHTAVPSFLASASDDHCDDFLLLTAHLPRSGLANPVPGLE
jgi:hypothetical protein